jgi:hypothetical protein
MIARQHSSQMRVISAALSASSRPLAWLAPPLLVTAAARFRMAKAPTIARGISSTPMLKWCRLRWVCAPHRRSAGTSMAPMLSVSVRVWGMARRLLAGWRDHASDRRAGLVQNVIGLT